MEHTFPIPKEVWEKIRRSYAMTRPIDEVSFVDLTYGQVDFDDNGWPYMFYAALDSIVSIGHLFDSLFRTIDEIKLQWRPVTRDGKLTDAELELISKKHLGELHALRKAFIFELLQQAHLVRWAGQTYMYDPNVQRDVLEAMETFKPEPDSESPQDPEPGDGCRLRTVK